MTTASTRIELFLNDRRNVNDLTDLLIQFLSGIGVCSTARLHFIALTTFLGKSYFHMNVYTDLDTLRRSVLCLHVTF